MGEPQLAAREWSSSVQRRESESMNIKPFLVRLQKLSRPSDATSSSCPPTTGIRQIPRWPYDFVKNRLAPSKDSKLSNPPLLVICTARPPATGAFQICLSAPLAAEK